MKQSRESSASTSLFAATCVFVSALIVLEEIYVCDSRFI